MKKKVDALTFMLRLVRTFITGIIGALILFVSVVMMSLIAFYKFILSVLCKYTKKIIQ